MIRASQGVRHCCVHRSHTLRVKRPQRLAKRRLHLAALQRVHASHAAIDEFYSFLQTAQEKLIQVLRRLLLHSCNCMITSDTSIAWTV